MVKQKATRGELSVMHKRLLLISALVIFGLFLLMFLGGLKYGEDLQAICQSLYEKFGFWPMLAAVYYSDTVLSPVPPDIFLVIIAKSDLREKWYLFVFFLGAASSLAGVTGWVFGRYLSQKKWMPGFVRSLPEKNRANVEKYGAWAVAMGALTPLPFSMTCWSAGFLRMPFRIFIIGALMRFPRLFIYYWVIDSAFWGTQFLVP